jgi:Glycosyltransferases involved in cell wall biogenesis
MVIYMVTISLCMIVKNEEAVLRRCLDSVKETVDEIIIVDTGSVDKTKEIAAEYTPKVYDFVWIDDFSAARNEAFSKATMEERSLFKGDNGLPDVA